MQYSLCINVFTLLAHLQHKVPTIVTGFDSFRNLQNINPLPITTKL
jgi:hypothetical protein